MAVAVAGDRARRLGRRASRPAARPTAGPSAARPATAARARIPAAAVGGLARSGADRSATTTRASAAGDGSSTRGAESATRPAADSGNVVRPTPATLAVEGPFLEDGTLLKPVAVDTTVEDGSGPAPDLQGQGGRHAGRDRRQVRRLDDDRVVGERPQVQGRAAHRPGADDPAGQRPRRHGHPERHARRARGQVQASTSSDILTTNGLEDPNLVVGQVLVVPGAAGQGASRRPSRTVKSHDHDSRRPSAQRRRWRRSASGRPRPTAAGTSSGRSSAAATTSASTSTTATTRSTSRPTTAPRSRAGGGGTVIFAGWKNNGGGYQVWIAHGSNLYTTYNHMSAITVGRGQHVGAASRSGASARPATRRPAPPLRGLGRPGLGRRHAGQPARLPLGRSPRRLGHLRGAGPDAVRECVRCSSTA